MPVIPALRKWRQEALELEASLCYIARLCGGREGEKQEGWKAGKERQRERERERQRRERERKRGREGGRERLI
jgi:hypothetical protein